MSLNFTLFCITFLLIVLAIGMVSSAFKHNGKKED